MAEIVILTGAGISAESGLGTFRDKDGIWTKHDLEDVATPEGFARDPAMVHRFYNARRQGLLEAEPNPAHRALRDLERSLGNDILLVTQNVDDLHERAGHQRVVHMHGELLKSLCGACGHRRRIDGDLTPNTVCEKCGATGSVRPDVVWFGEFPYHMELIYEALRGTALFVSIGTSGEVYPAAGFVQDARSSGAETLELNLETTSRAFHQSITGIASEVVPKWVDSVLATRSK